MTVKITTADIEREKERRKYFKWDYFFPDVGELRRELYKEHVAFFRAGATFKERLFLAANRTGKTEGGAFEVTCHLTGLYPEWWEGRRFKKPVNVLVAGETSKLVRDSLQKKLLGELGQEGTGMLPRHVIGAKRPKHGIPDAVDICMVKHVSGGESILQFQSYDQGRTAFQATERDVVWCDEEPPLDVYGEAATRTMTTKGLIITTFTPLKGVSSTVQFLQRRAEAGEVYLCSVTWDDVPHLSEEDKRVMLMAYPPHQRDARTRGIPSMGAGAIYAVPEEHFVIDPIQIPPHWVRFYGLDVGWNNTAACWFALDRDTDTMYLYDSYKVGALEPAQHCAAIKARGTYLHGEIDPASNGRSQIDGGRLLELYKGLGLKLHLAENAVEAGIFEVWQRLVDKRLKVFSTNSAWLAEYRMYRRCEKGKVVKENDHLMDAMRYGVVSGGKHGKLPSQATGVVSSFLSRKKSWMSQ